MATLGQLYYNRTDCYTYPDVSHNDELGCLPAALNIPAVSQPTILREHDFYPQRYQTLQVPDTKRFRPENASHSHRTSDKEHLTSSSESYNPTACRPLINRSQGRSDNLKRRPSLREAARSFRSSKVVKKLRRHGKADNDPENGDEAGASASESDNHCEFVPEQKLGSAQLVEPPRSASVVSELTNGLQSTLTFTTHGRGRVSSSASAASSQINSSDSASSRTSFTSLSVMSKRSRNGEDEELDGDDEDDSDRHNKRNCSISSLGPEQPQLFACPFSKHDCHRYSAANLEELNYRGCSQSYLTDLARVKQHLYRVHERPAHHCPTCYETFKNQAQCIKHVSLQSCDARPCPFGEKMTPEQLLAIKKKNRGTDPYLGWYEIYKTLFPGSQLPMSPYAAFTTNVDTLESFMDHVLRELPMRLQHRLNLEDSMTNAIQAPLRDVLREIRRDFNPMQQQRSDSTVQNVHEPSAQTTDLDAPGHAHNFHQSVTLSTPLEPEKMQSMRPPAIEIPPPNMYLYAPSQSTQVMSDPMSLHTTYDNQELPENMRVNYGHQQFQYPLQDVDPLQDLDGVTPKAIWPVRDNNHSYFVGQHQQPQSLSTYLHVQSEGNWIPNMVTTSIDQSMNDPSMQDIMGNFFHGSYPN